MIFLICKSNKLMEEFLEIFGCTSIWNEMRLMRMDTDIKKGINYGNQVFRKRK